MSLVTEVNEVKTLTHDFKEDDLYIAQGTEVEPVAPPIDWHDTSVIALDKKPVKTPPSPIPQAESAMSVS